MLQDIDAASPRHIGAATAVALLIAIVVLLTAVLPAEYGIDPLGTGRALGLSTLADVRPGVIAPQPDDHKVDAVEFVLAPFESVEYKYRLQKGGTLLYSWQATGTVVADFHSEPDGAGPGYAESFDKRRSDAARGTYTAPFAGIHGWFWENRGTADVTIRLTTAGFYSAAQEFRGGDSVFHEVTAASTRCGQPAGAPRREAAGISGLP